MEYVVMVFDLNARKAGAGPAAEMGRRTFTGATRRKDAYAYFEALVHRFIREGTAATITVVRTRRDGSCAWVAQY